MRRLVYGGGWMLPPEGGRAAATPDTPVTLFQIDVEKHQSREYIHAYKGGRERGGGGRLG